MLKLKKNMPVKAMAQQKTSQYLDIRCSQTDSKKQLDSLLSQQPLPYQKILSLLKKDEENSFASISGLDFTKIFVQVLLPDKLQESNIQLVLDILIALIQVSQQFRYLQYSDSKQVKTQIKSSIKNKKIDSLLILALIWKRRSNPATWKYVEYLMECFPTEILLNGKQFLDKWKVYFDQRQTQLKSEYQIQQIIQENQIKLHMSQDSKAYKDIYINL